MSGAAGAPVGAAAEEGLPVDLLGQLAMIGLTLLIIVTLNRWFPCHRWLPTDQLMGPLVFVADVHVALVLLDGTAATRVAGCPQRAARGATDDRCVPSGLPSA